MLSKKLFLIALYISLLFAPMTVYATDWGYGSEIQVEDQSLTDIFRETPNQNAQIAQTEQFKEKSSAIFDFAGYVISALILVVFAMLVFTTACDLTYIAAPAIRPLLAPTLSYSGGGNQMNSGMQRPMGNISMPSTGGFSQGISGNGQKNKDYCLVSETLRKMVQSGILERTMQNPVPTNNLQYIRQEHPISIYLHRRIIRVVIIVVILMLLTTSTIFTQFGMNIGGLILNIFTDTKAIWSS